MIQDIKNTTTNLENFARHDHVKSGDAAMFGNIFGAAQQQEHDLNANQVRDTKDSSRDRLDAYDTDRKEAKEIKPLERRDRKRRDDDDTLEEDKVISQFSGKNDNESKRVERDQNVKNETSEGSEKAEQSVEEGQPQANQDAQVVQESEKKTTLQMLAELTNVQYARQQAQKGSSEEKQVQPQAVQTEQTQLKPVTDVDLAAQKEGEGDADSAAEKQLTVEQMAEQVDDTVEIDADESAAEDIQEDVIKAAAKQDEKTPVQDDSQKQAQLQNEVAQTQASPNNDIEVQKAKLYEQKQQDAAVTSQNDQTTTVATVMTAETGMDMDLGHQKKDHKSMVSDLVDPMNKQMDKPFDIKSITAGERAEQPRQVDMQENIDKIVKSARAVQTGKNTTLQLRLDPPELGSLRVEIKHSTEGLSLQLEATNQKAHQLLQQNSHELKAALEAHGLQTNSIQIQLRLDLGNEQHAQDGSGQGQQGQGQPGQQNPSQQQGNFNEQFQQEQGNYGYPDVSTSDNEQPWVLPDIGDQASTGAQTVRSAQTADMEWEEMQFGRLDMIG